MPGIQPGGDRASPACQPGKMHARVHSQVGTAPPVPVCELRLEADTHGRRSPYRGLSAKIRHVFGRNVGGQEPGLLCRPCIVVRSDPLDGRAAVSGYGT